MWFLCVCFCLLWLMVFSKFVSIWMKTMKTMKTNTNLIWNCLYWWIRMSQVWTKVYERSLFHHMRGHNSIHQSEKCPKKFEAKVKLERHCEIAHKPYNERKYACNKYDCNKRFTFAETFLTYDSCKDTKFKCTIFKKRNGQ